MFTGIVQMVGRIAAASPQGDGVRIAVDTGLHSSGDVAIEYLLRSTPHRSAYVVGTPGLVEDARAAGLRIDEESPDCVLLGYDSTLTYAKLEIACRHIFAGKPYYATHPDRTCITQHGLIPDIAAIIAACEAVTTIPPTRVLGKPSPEMVEVALRRIGGGATVETTAMVGDQLDTDLTMARDSGLVGVLVMTGETTPAKLAAWPKEKRPAIIARGVDQLVEWLR